MLKIFLSVTPTNFEEYISYILYQTFSESRVSFKEKKKAILWRAGKAVRLILH